MSANSYYVVKKHNGKFLSVDGRTCLQYDTARVKRFKSEQDAVDFLNDPHLRMKVHFLPNEIHQNVLADWTIHEVKAVYQLCEGTPSQANIPNR